MHNARATLRRHVPQNPHSLLPTTNLQSMLKLLLYTRAMAGKAGPPLSSARPCSTTALTNPWPLVTRMKTCSLLLPMRAMLNSMCLMTLVRGETNHTPLTKACECSFATLARQMSLDTTSLCPGGPRASWGTHTTHSHSTHVEHPTGRSTSLLD